MLTRQLRQLRRKTVGLKCSLIVTGVVASLLLYRTAQRIRNTSITDMQYANVNLALQQPNRFDHCDAMNDGFEDDVIFIRPLRLVYCHLPKNMVTQISALFIRAYQNEQFLLEDETDLRRLWVSRLDRFNSIPEMVTAAFGARIDELKSVDHFEYLVIIRHPFDRFVAAFYHVCFAEALCDNGDTNYCKREVYCLLRHLRHLQQRCLWYESCYNSLAMVHFVPQAYMCYLRKMRQNTRLFVYSKTLEFRESLTTYMVRAGIPSAVVSTGWGRRNSSWLNATTYHTSDSFATQKDEILANATVLSELFYIYQADFKMFQFAMPKSVHEHCANSANFRDRICAYLRSSH